jgi:trk system potassium uptake protein TrkH
MNFRTVIYQLTALGLLLSGVMVAMAAAFLVTRWLGDRAIDPVAVRALFLTGIGAAIVSGALRYLVRKCDAFLGRKEALLLVSLGWVFGALIGAIPYWMWANQRFLEPGAHPFQSLTNCYFESMSGFTTTGATILSEIESLPHSLLLWRSLTHWLGGLGIVVLFVAVLPGLGVGGKRLFQIESPGPSPEGLQPHIRETARWLWFIYLGLTLLEIAMLWALTPMDGFSAVCHTFGTLATGGFSTMNASIGAYYRSPAVDIIITCFMVMAGVNFGLYYRLCRGNVRDLLGDTELRVFLCCIFAATAIISFTLYFTQAPIYLTDGQPVAPTLGESVRHGLFKTVSIQTTTGYCTTDFNRWPFIAKAILVCLMFIGGSSGSTAGGIKVIRIWIAFKVLLADLERAYRPNVIRPVRVGRVSVDPEMRLGAVSYVLGAIVIFAVGSILIKVFEGLNTVHDCDYTTAATATAATFFNVGPGLGKVGAVANYGWFTPLSKWFMVLLMALGRLEVFAIIVLLRRGFWREN